jgi:hypothetical protein
MAWSALMVKQEFVAPGMITPFRSHWYWRLVEEADWALTQREIVLPKT